MMVFLKIAAFAIALLALSWAIKYVIATSKILQLRLRFARPQPVEWTEIPAPIQAVLADAAAWAEANGFRLARHVLLPASTNGDVVRYGSYFLHDNGHTCLSVGGPVVQAEARSWMALFSTRCNDGIWHVTAPKIARLLATPSPGVVVHEERDDVDGRCRRHFAWEEGETFSPITSVGDALDEVEALRERHYQAAVVAGELRQVKDAFGFTLKGAIGYVLRFFANEREAARAKKMPGAVSAAPQQDATRLALGWGEWRESRKALVAGRLGAFVMFLATLALFMVAGGIAFSFGFVVVLTMVLLVHEGGHWLAMRLLGYTDTAIYFVPMLGALATGKHERESAWREALVLLAGPVPGLLFGTSIVLTASAGYPAWLMQAAQVAIFLNLFNLMPIEPLDGGRLVNLALFNRSPRLHSIFYVFGVIAFGALTWSLGGSFMWVMVALLAIAIPARLRENRALARLLAQSPLPADDDRRSRLAIAAAVEVQPAAPPANQYMLAESLLRRLNHAAAGVVERVVIFTAWAAAIVAPVAVFASLFFSGLASNSSPLAAQTPDEWIQWLHDKREEDPETAVKLASMPISAFVEKKDWEAVNKLLPEIEATLDGTEVSAEVRSSEMARVAAVLAQASLPELQQRSWSYYDRALSICAADSGGAGCRGQVYAIRAGARKEIGDRLGAIGDLEVALQAPEPEYAKSRGWSHRYMRESLAGLYAENGMPQSAENALLSGLSGASSPADRLELTAEAARLRAGHGDLPQALTLLDGLHAAQPFGESRWRLAIDVETAWLHLDAGDVDAAKAVIGGTASSDPAVLLTKHIVGVVAHDSAVASSTLDALLKIQAANEAHGDYPGFAQMAIADELRDIGVFATGADARWELMEKTFEADADAVRAADPARAEAITTFVTFAE